jgi:hypothetical protein
MSQGFEIINQNLWIEKDPEAQLFYTFDWSDWLTGNDTIASAVYTVTARINDPSPIVRVTNGITGGNKTFVELRGGQVNKSYVVSVKVTTTTGLIDRRSFRVKVENRSA